MRTSDTFGPTRASGHTGAAGWKARLILALALVVGGAGQALAQGHACIPGAQIECSCVGGVKSVQICAPDGASLQPCQCGGVAPPPAVVGPMPALPPPSAGFGASGPAPVAVAATTGDAGIDVTTAAPATILLDGAEVGRAPLHLGPLVPGIHVLKAQFDSGGDVARKVRVLPGQVSQIDLGSSSRRRLGLAHTFTVSAGVLSQENHAGGGLGLEYALNFGVANAVDLRLGVRALFGPADRGFLATFGIPLSARFNFGATYALGIGGFAGLRSAPAHHWAGSVNSGARPRETGAFAGPELFPIILRVGGKRELEFGLGGGILVPLTSSEESAYIMWHGSLVASFLIL